MGMQRMRREGVEVTPGLVPWRGEGRSGTGVFAIGVYSMYWLKKMQLV